MRAQSSLAMTLIGAGREADAVHSAHMGMHRRLLAMRTASRTKYGMAQLMEDVADVTAPLGTDSGTAVMGSQGLKQRERVHFAHSTSA